MMMSDTGIDFDANFPVPPGEEGMDLSHEGGEYEAFTGLSQQVASLSGWCVLLFHVALTH